MLDPLHDESLLARWLAGTLSDSEVKALEQHEDFPAFQQIIESMESFRTPEYDEQKAWKHFAEKAGISIEKPVRSIQPINWFIGMAAAILILTATYLFWPISNQIKHLAEAGTTKTIELPDGSKVILNADSEIQYPKNFLANRSIKLSGEAFFEVESINQSGEPLPFQVFSKQGIVQVLGTEFNIYDRENDFQVQVMGGRVSVSDLNREEQGILEQNQQLSWSEVTGWEQSEIEASDQPIWLRETVTLERPIIWIIQELERRNKLEIDLPEGKEKEILRIQLNWKKYEEALNRICQLKGWTLQKISDQQYRIIAE